MEKKVKKKNNRPRGYFNSAENVLIEIRKRFEEGSEISSRVVQREDGTLYQMALKHFNSWGKAILSAGYEYDSIKKTINWDAELVRKSLVELKKNGTPMNISYLLKHHKSLANACNTYFDSYANAIEECIGNYNDIKKYNVWTKEKVIAELLARYNNNLPLSPTNLIDENRSLYAACHLKFGSYKKAIESCGLIYQDIIKYEIWNKEKIQIELTFRHTNNLPLNSSAIIQDFEMLYGACQRHFGDYRTAIESVGLNYETIQENLISKQYYGHEFEAILGNILFELNIPFTKGFSRKFQPDFVFGLNKWADAKLSEWTVFNGCETIEKYEPQCRFLTIIFLRGNKFKDEMITKKTRILSVYKLIKQLPKQKRKHYEILIKELWDRAEN